jgi:hypothetical protein
MTAWKENDKFEFDFHNAHEINNLRDGSSEITIKNKLRERLKNSKVLIVLVGANTKNLFKYVRWEIEWAVEYNIPIIVVNLDNKKKINTALCPPILRNMLAIHIPFGHKVIDHALNNWPNSYMLHQKADDTGPHHYNQSLYDRL